MTIDECLAISRDLGIAAFCSGNATMHIAHASFSHLYHDRSFGFGARDRTKMIDAWRAGYDWALTQFEQR